MEDSGEAADPIKKVRASSVTRMPLEEVDRKLIECEKMIKSCSDTVKSRLGGTMSLPPKVLIELSRANAQRVRLMMRRVAILIESGDPTASELMDKLMKVKLKGS